MTTQTSLPGDGPVVDRPGDGPVTDRPGDGPVVDRPDDGPVTDHSSAPGTGPVTDHSRARADAAHSHAPVGGRVGASRADRPTSYDIADFPLPTGREEEWRFTPIEPLRPLFSADLPGTLATTVDPAPGVRVEEVGRTDARLGLTAPPGDRIAAAAWASFTTATVVTLTADGASGTATPVAGEDLTRDPAADAASSDTVDNPADPEAPPRTTVRITGSDATPSAAHLVVVAEAGARGAVVIEHTGTAALTQTVEIVLGQGADVTLVSVQDWDADAVHATTHRVRVGRDAHLRHVAVTLGGAVVRLTPEAAFAGPGGDLEMLGLYLTDAGRHHEQRLYVDHNQPHCRSRVAYKGALQGTDAHSVWVGDVLIRAEAEGTDTYELNRNLVLTDGARADSVPNLEIETGEIAGAGHASATGRFDDEQLFYLCSRGIPEAVARRLVVHGFFAELVDRIGLPDLQHRLIEAIDARLAGAVDAASTEAEALAEPAGDAGTAPLVEAEGTEDPVEPEGGRG